MSYGAPNQKGMSPLDRKNGNGPVKAVRHHDRQSDSQRGPARTGQLGMRSHAFKGGIAGQDDLLASQAGMFGRSAAPQRGRVLSAAVGKLGFLPQSR